MRGEQLPDVTKRPPQISRGVQTVRREDEIELRPGEALFIR